MRMLVRHLAAILLLPFVVAVVVPEWLARAGGDTRWTGTAALAAMARLGGAALIVAGAVLFAWCVSLFVRVGRGTLAPWDPTQRLVAAGPYRLVRNPMITGVALVLAGQALVRGSLFGAAWAVGFILINHFYFIHIEEPGLRRRFGDSYGAYAARVPRWLPHRRK